MKPKMRGWKEGVLAKDLNGMGGHSHRKGHTVRYKVYKVYPDKDGYVFNEKEYHVLDLDNYNLIRTGSLFIEGEILPNYWEQYYEKRKRLKNV